MTINTFHIKDNRHLLNLETEISSLKTTLKNLKDTKTFLYVTPQNQWATTSDKTQAVSVSILENYYYQSTTPINIQSINDQLALEKREALIKKILNHQSKAHQLTDFERLQLLEQESDLYLPVEMDQHSDLEEDIILFYRQELLKDKKAMKLLKTMDTARKHLLVNLLRDYPLLKEHSIQRLLEFSYVELGAFEDLLVKLKSKNPKKKNSTAYTTLNEHILNILSGTKSTINYTQKKVSFNTNVRVRSDRLNSFHTIPLNDVTEKNYRAVLKDLNPHSNETLLREPQEDIFSHEKQLTSLFEKLLDEALDHFLTHHFPQEMLEHKNTIEANIQNAKSNLSNLLIEAYQEAVKHVTMCLKTFSFDGSPSDHLKLQIERNFTKKLTLICRTSEYANLNRELTWLDQIFDIARVTGTQTLDQIHIENHYFFIDSLF